MSQALSKAKDSKLFRAFLALALALTMIPIGVFMSADRAYGATTGTVTVGKEYSWNHEYTTITQHTHYMEIDGQIAICAQHMQTVPKNGATATVKIAEATDTDLRKVAYYGYGGPGHSGMTGSQKLNIVQTACAMDWAYSNGDHEGYSAQYAYNLLDPDSLPTPPSNFIVTVWKTSSGYQDLVTWKIKSSTGYIELYKASSNTSVTSGNSDYSLSGAVYTVYSDAACTNAVTTMTTNASGYAKSSELAAKTYYVKETTAPKGYYLDSTKYVAPVSSGSTVRIQSDSTGYVYDDPIITTNPPAEVTTGSIVLMKESSDPSASAGYSLAGAVYGVYSNSSCTTLVDTMTTNSNGYASLSDITVGTYYVKEKSAPSGFELDTRTYTVTVTAGGTVYVNGGTVYDDPVTGNIVLNKYSSDTSITSGNSSYSLAGAVYGVYSNYSCTNLVSRMTTDSSGYASLSGLSLGTYYVKEITAPTGYYVDNSVYTVYVDGGTEYVNGGYVYDTPYSGEINLKKSSSAPSWTTDNDCYSLSGAVYGVYSNSGCTNLVGRMVTDANGNASLEDLPLGNYYVKEISASEGFALDQNSYSASISSYNLSPSINVVEYPMLDPIPAWVGKIDLETTLDMPQGSASLAGAEFTINYYDGFYNNIEEVTELTPLYTWVVYTNDNGFATIPLEDQFDNGDGLFGIPLGTVTIEETKAPSGYHRDTTVNIRHITAEGTDTTVETYNQPIIKEQVMRGDIALMKYGETTMNEEFQPELKEPLAHVSFEIINASDNAVVRPDGTSAAKGEVVVTITTDEQGWATTNDHKADGTDGALPFGTYTIHEVASTTPEGYKAVEDFNVAVSENGVTLHYMLQDKTGTALQIVKQDAETGKIVSGFTTFRVLNANKEVVSFTSHYPAYTVHETFTTAADGTCLLPEKLMAGTYYIQEMTAPDGYLLNDELVEFTVDGSTVNSWSEPLKVVLQDMPAMGQIVITKTDADTGNAVLAKTAEFDIIAAEDIVTADGTVRVEKGETVDHVVANNGEYRSVELYLGKYQVVETKAPSGYVLNSTPVETTLVYKDQLTEVVTSNATVTDDPAMGIITVTKLDKETGKTVEAEGTTFEVTAAEDIVGGDGTVHVKSGDLVATLVTDATGTASTGELYLGKYTVTETQAPYPYVLDSDPQTVTLSYADQNTPVVYASAFLGNTEQKGTITLTKLDAETDKPVLVAGAEFNIVAAEDIKSADGTIRFAEGTVVSSFSTNAEGIATSNLLFIGKYKLVETKAPTGYVLNTEPVEVNIEYVGQTVAVSSWSAALEDMSQKGIITISKLDKTTGEVVTVPGARFEVIAAADIVTGDGTVRAKQGDVVATLATDETGSVSSEALYLGSYIISEVDAPYGYVLDSEDVTVTLSYGDQTVAVISESTSISNAEQMGTITLTKVDAETGETIKAAGVAFDIYTAEDILFPNGEVRIAANTKVGSVVTDENGVATTEALYIGSYSFIETQAPEGYTLNASPIAAKIEYVDQNVAVSTWTVDADNMPQKGMINVIKVDAETGEIVKIAGAEFDIIAAQDIVTADGTVRVTAGEVVDHVITDEEGQAVTKMLYLGEYIVSETQAPEGYVLDSEDQNVSLSYGDQTLVYVEETVSMENMPQKGVISITKSDELTDDVLEGAEFEVYAAEDIVTGDGMIRVAKDELVDTVTTDEDGIATTEELYLGKYYVVESAQPSGYVLNAEPIEVELAYSNQDEAVVTVPIEQTNQPNEVIVKKLRQGTETALEGVTFGYWNVEDEVEIVTDEGTGKIAVMFDVPAGIEVVGLAAMNADGEVVSEFTWNEEGYFESDNLAFSIYDVVISYTINSEDLITEETLISQVILTEDLPIARFLATANEGSAVVEDEGVESEDPEGSDADTETGFEYELADGVREVEGTILSEEDGQIVAALSEEESVEVGDIIVINIDDIVNGRAIKIESIVEADGNIEVSGTIPALEEVFKSIHLEGEVDISDGEFIPAPGVTLIEEETDFNIDNIEVVDEVVWNVCAKSAYVPADKITEVSTNELGLISVHRLDEGVYGFGEISTLPGYVLNTTVQYVSVAENGLVNGEECPVLTFENDYTKVQISKKDIVSSEEIPGATLTVFDSEGNVVDEWVSGNEPHMIDTLIPGNYILREIIAPEGYLVANDVEFTVLETGVIQSVVMYDDYTKVDVLKVAAETDKALPGAKLALIDEDGNYVDIRNLIKGEDIVIEEIIVDANGNVIKTTKVEADSDEDDVVTDEVVDNDNATDDEATNPPAEDEGIEDGEDSDNPDADNPDADNPDVDNPDADNPDADVNNAASDSDEAVSDEDLEAELLGVAEEESAKTVAKDSAKEEIASGNLTIYAWTSTDEAVRINHLPAGDYALTELVAPKGYGYADDVNFTVKAVGDVQSVVMEDELIPTEDIDKTGDTLVQALLASGIVSIVAAGGVLIYIRRKENC